MKWILISFIASVAAAAATDYGIVSSENDTIYSDKEKYETPLHLGPDWITIAAFDTSRGDECPSSFVRVHALGKSVCSASYGCSSYTYKVNGLFYNEIAGVVRGYQKGTTDAFQASTHGKGINDVYVDGVSITIGNPRQHVWTFAAGLTQLGNYADFNCPCAVTPGPNAPSFVGDHYYCSSGAITYASKSAYYTAPLWQGNTNECLYDNCCAKLGLPWFHRKLLISQSKDIEVRICNNQEFNDEAVLIDQLILVVRNKI